MKHSLQGPTRCGARISDSVGPVLMPWAGAAFGNPSAAHAKLFSPRQ